jgi:signal transduction histidine kinase
MGEVYKAQDAFNGLRWTSGMRRGNARGGSLAGILFFLLMTLCQGAAAFGAFAETTQVVPAPVRATLAPRRVLMLYSDNRLLPANILFEGSFREALRSHDGEPIDCCSEFLDEVRFPAGHLERMRDLVQVKYGESPPDVIVAFAPPALDFCLRYRSQLFPQVPIVFAGIGTDIPAEAEVGPGVTGVRSTFDGPATLHLALRLHPRTEQVFVFDGSAPVDSAAMAMRWSTFRQSASHATLHHLTGLPLPQLLEELSRVPENSLVMDLSVFGSTAGSSVPTQEMAERLARVSLAPIYAAFDPLVGYGVVGAVTTPMDTIGRKTAELVAQVLESGDTDELPAIQTLAATPILDWRQLRRWGLRKSQLPPGTIVRFEQPPFWRQHLPLVMTTGGLLLLQSGLIIALVLQNRRRRGAEREAQLRREELAHMMRVATMGELTASLAHEINQPLAAILSNAQAGQRLLAAGADGQEIGEILADIAADDRRAGEVIRRMRTLLRKGESELTIVDVNDLLAEVIDLVRGEMILQNVSLELELSFDPPLVHGDPIQLQQVLLNLVANALDAMKEMSGGHRRLVLRTTAPDDRSVQVSVADSGVGVPADRLEQVFERFVTTKPHGLGLGLTICRSIIQAHGGSIGCTNNGRGATFWFTLPAVEREL